MNPIDYTSAMADLPTSGASFMQGVKDGSGMQQLQLQQQQAALAQQQAMQMRADLSSLSQNPTTDAIGRMSVRYPQLSEQFKRSVDMLEPAQRQAKLDHATQVYAALHNQQPEVAQKILADQAAALRNSGNEKDAKASETMAALIKQNPAFAQTTAGLMISSAMGADKFAAAFTAIGGEERAGDLHGAALSRAESEAMKAGVEASVAQDTAGLKVEQAGEDILTAQAKRRVDEFNVQIGQADSETKRGNLILERDKFVAEQSLKQVDASKSAQNQMDKLNISLDTVKSILAHPGLEGWFGAGSLSGKVAAMMPGTDSKDVRAMVDTLKSQEFLNAIPQIQGLGALSNAEGAKLETAIASLDMDQSQTQMKNNLGVIRSILQKSEAKLIAGNKLPTTGGGFVFKHPTFGNVNEGDINRLMKQFPGTTRAQVLEYLGKGGK